MAEKGTPFSHEVLTGWTPEEANRNLALYGEQFGEFGYNIEQHTANSIVLARRYTPELAWKVPLTFAVVVFFLALAAGSTEAAGNAGRVAFFACVVAVILALVVKTTERLTLFMSPDGANTRIVASGLATASMGDYIRSWDLVEGEAVGSG